MEEGRKRKSILRDEEDKLDRALKQKILAELGDISEDIYDELVKEVCAQAEIFMAQAKEALKRVDFSQVADAAHSLKGAAANLRLEELARLSKEIEMSAKEKKDAAQILKTVELVETARTKVLSEFRS